MNPLETQKPDLSSLRIDRGESNSRRPVNAKVVVFVIVVVALALAYVLMMGNLSPAIEVELTTATLTYPSQANAVLTASGYVVAQQKAAVASKGTGRLVYLGVQEGDAVKKGQIIGRLEDQDVVAALVKARADLEYARADLQDAQTSRDRQRALFGSGLASKADLDAAEARFLRVRASIASAEAAVTSAEVAVENTRIRAPFDGTVLTKDADVGEMVTPFGAAANSRGAVVTMADMSSLEVEADVSESNITRVTLDQPCEIVLDAYPDVRYAGFVDKIVPTADRAKATVLTKVRFKNRDARVLPEMSAKVNFLSKELDAATAQSSPTLTVPAGSVVTRDQKQVVLLVRDGAVVEKPVRTGRHIGDRIEIMEGLVQGDQIVLRPDPGLTTGSKVKIRQ
jgi:RND family efflux transporter MFP subunit